MGWSNCRSMHDVGWGSAGPQPRPASNRAAPQLYTCAGKAGQRGALLAGGRSPSQYMAWRQWTLLVFYCLPPTLPPIWPRGTWQSALEEPRRTKSLGKAHRAKPRNSTGEIPYGIENRGSRPTGSPTAYLLTYPCFLTYNGKSRVPVYHIISRQRLVTSRLHGWNGLN